MLDRPAASPSPRTPGDRPLLEVRDLVKHFPSRGGLLRRIVGHLKAVDGVSFSVQAGETLALVGESGCGKTTVGRLICRLIEPGWGQILFRDSARGADAAWDAVDLVSLSGVALKRVRTQVQMTVQDPFSSLNPRMSIKEILAEPFAIHGMGTRAPRRNTTSSCMRRTGHWPIGT